MTLRVLTYSGALELGQAAPGAPKCERCDKRANVEVDVVTGFGPAKVVPIVKRGLRTMTTRRGEPRTRRVALCSGCVADLVGQEFSVGKHG